MSICNEIKKACTIIENEMSEKSKNNFKKSNFNDLIDYHFSIGLWIRNNILTENSDILLCFEEINVKNTDDISLFIFHKCLLNN